MRDLVMTDANRRQRNVRPWNGAPIVGDKWSVMTDRLNPVNVWVPRMGTPQSRCYFCHGWSLATWALHGYSVYSGPDMATVLEDEWFEVDDEPRPLDICVWYGDKDGHVRTPLHSARIESIYMCGTIYRMSSKNGAEPMGGTAFWSTVDDMYRGAPHNCYETKYFRRQRRLAQLIPHIAD